MNKGKAEKGNKQILRFPSLENAAVFGRTPTLRTLEDKICIMYGE